MVCRIGLMELHYVIHHYPQIVREAEVGWAAMTILHLLVGSRILVALQTTSRHPNGHPWIKSSTLDQGPETSWFPLSTERQCTARASVASHSDGSPSSLSSETGTWELNCETIGDGDTSSIGRLTPLQDRIIPSHWRYNSSSIEHKFHTTLTEFQKAETSPDPSASSRREGFRWSSASSYDMGFDGENFDIAEHMAVESLRSPHCPAGDKKCGVCGKLLRQKSPWSSNRIMRGGDMPIAGVLPCSHVFHAECLEQMTPQTQIHDPPCPACLKTIGLVDQETSMVSESLQMALRSVGGNRGVVIANTQERCSNDEVSNQFKDGSSRAGPRLKGSAALIRNHLKKRLTFKGQIGLDCVILRVFPSIFVLVLSCWRLTQRELVHYLFKCPGGKILLIVST
ncbi:hypothetical protein F0562_016167 [Nyssa sinensis]|uniref:RING-type domain-containing protein n=1 Tax=Nyssa sinensis TaxID=561372 RepID=A0A5J4ZM93_9ASTE|nr:hypothetical protein F0562_016167 [Nyssa sinensis]